MLTARLVPVPLLASAIAAAGEMSVKDVHGYETGVSVALLLAGVGSAFLLAWRARGEKDSICARLANVERAVGGLACQREKRAECEEKGAGASDQGAANNAER